MNNDVAYIEVGKNLLIALQYSILGTLYLVPSDRLETAVTFLAIFTAILVMLAAIDQILKDSYIWSLIKDLLTIVWVVFLLISMILDVLRRTL